MPLPPTMAAILGAAATPSPGVQNLAPSALVRFDVAQVSPPSALYVTILDRLQLQFACNGTVNNTVFLEVRILGADGEVVIQEETINVPSGQYPPSMSYPLPEGFVLSVAVTPKAGTFFRGNIFCMISLQRGSTAAPQYSFMLAHGYLGRIAPVCWPYPRVDSPTAYGGLLAVETVAAPGAGTDFTLTPDPLSRQRVVSVTGSLTASATVANRTVTLVINYLGTSMLVCPSFFTQTAGTTVVYNWWVGAPTVTTPWNGVVVAPLGNGVFINNSGWTVGSATGSLQAGDQWSAAHIMFEEWLDE